MEDPIHFIENYVYIQNKDSETGICLFKLRPFQKEIIKAYQDPEKRYVCVKVGRQLGKTITSAAYFLWCTIFKPHFDVLILANQQQVAIETIDRIKIMIQYLPTWLQSGTKTWNQTSIQFGNKSKIVAKATTKSSGRGSTFNIVYVDEIAHIEENIMRPFMESSFPVITSAITTKFLCTSTPKGLNMFYKIFTEALSGKNNFFPLEFPWDVDGIRDEAFKQEIISDFDERYFSQEYECNFLGSAGTLLDTKILSSLAYKDPIEKKRIRNTDFVLKIYEQPIKGNKYLVTHDPSEGLGDGENSSIHDYTGIHVWDITNTFFIKQVATLYDNRIDVNIAPYVLKDICLLYNEAFEISENNLFPEIPKYLMIYVDYVNVYIHRRATNKKERYGIRMTQSSRNKGLAIMKKMFKNKNILINDFDTIRELSVFTEKNGRYEADAGYHDDLVTSMNLLCWLISDKENYKRFVGSEDSKYMKDVHKIDAEDEELLLLVDDGIGNPNDWGSNNGFF
jgi:hypothetical protein